MDPTVCLKQSCSGFRFQTCCEIIAISSSIHRSSQIEHCVYFSEEVSQYLCSFIGKLVCVSHFEFVRHPCLHFSICIIPLGHVGPITNKICREGQKPYFYELLQHLVADLMPQLLYNKAKTLTEVKEPANQTILCKSWQSPAKMHGRVGLKNEETFKFTDLMRPQMINELRSDSWMTERSAGSFFPIQKGA